MSGGLTVLRANFEWLVDELGRRNPHEVGLCDRARVVAELVEQLAHCLGLDGRRPLPLPLNKTIVRAHHVSSRLERA